MQQLSAATAFPVAASVIWDYSLITVSVNQYFCNIHQKSVEHCMFIMYVATQVGYGRVADLAIP